MLPGSLQTIANIHIMSFWLACLLAVLCATAVVDAQLTSGEVGTRREQFSAGAAGQSQGYSGGSFSAGNSQGATRGTANTFSTTLGSGSAGTVSGGTSRTSSANTLGGTLGGTSSGNGNSNGQYNLGGGNGNTNGNGNTLGGNGNTNGNRNIGNQNGERPKVRLIARRFVVVAAFFCCNPLGELFCRSLDTSRHSLRCALLTANAGSHRHA